MPATLPAGGDPWEVRPARGCASFAHTYIRRERVRSHAPTCVCVMLQDERWRGVSWTVYRDKAYDLGPFFATHPGGKCVPSLTLTPFHHTHTRSC